MWLLFALSGPVLWAASTHIDKYLVERYFKHGSIAVLMVFTAIVGLLMLPVIWYYRPDVFALPLLNIAVMVLSGIFYMGAMYFYLRALQGEEASTVAPMFQAAPLFGYALAFVFLGERLTPLQISGAALVVLGSFLLSYRFSGKHQGFKTRFVLLMLACALAIALSSLIFKFYAIEDEYWTTTFWNAVGEAFFGAVLLFPSENRKDFTRMLSKNTGAVLGINAANELINLGGGLGTRYALLLAPLAIVQAISGTTSLFVLGFGVLLSVFFPSLGREELERGTLAQKTLATLLVAAGVILVNA